MRRSGPDFDKEGIPTSDPLARKLWVVSVIQGHRNPFGKPITDYAPHELDFVAEMAALDEPDHWTFTRAGVSAEVRSNTLAEWRDRLGGPALSAFLGRTGLATAMRGIARWHASRSTGGLRPGLTRGGKKITDASDPN